MSQYKATFWKISAHVQYVKKIDEDRKYAVHEQHNNQQFLWGKTPEEHQRVIEYENKLWNHFVDWKNRIAFYQNTMLEIRSAERLARGDGNTAALRRMQTE